MNWLDSCIIYAGRQERRKEGMPPGMFGNLKNDAVQGIPTRLKNNR